MFRKILFALLATLSFGFAHAATCVVGPSGATPTATLTFAAVTLNTDGSAITAPVTYNLYQGTASGAEVKVATALVVGANTLKTGLLANTSYYWYVTAVDASGTEGAPSNEGCKSFSKVVPGTTSITIT